MERKEGKKGIVVLVIRNFEKITKRLYINKRLKLTKVRRVYSKKCGKTGKYIEEQLKRTKVRRIYCEKCGKIKFRLKILEK